MGGNYGAGAAEPGMCYDRKRDRVVIYGGWDRPGDFRGRTWEWNGETLTPVDSSGPSPRSGHALVWEPIREGCLLFGGRGVEGYHDDTWIYDGEGWSELNVPGPSPRWFFGAATDPERKRILLFGGRGPEGDLGDTWEWDGVGWERVGTDGPEPRSMAKMAFSGERVLLFGGRRQVEDGNRDLADTWLWIGDAVGWSRR